MNKLFLFINLIILPGSMVQAQKSIAGVYGPNGLILLDAGESVIKKNMTVPAEKVTPLFNSPTEFGEINIFFFNSFDTSIRNSFSPFISDHTTPNSYKKISESEYEISVYDPSRMVLFGHGKLKEGFGIGMKLPGSGGLNATNLMGEEIDSLILTAGQQKKAYKIRSFNPFADSLALYIWDKKNNKPVLTFRIRFHFPAPVLSGITTDALLIQKKKNNPSFEWTDSKKTENNKHNKIILSSGNNATLLAFEHFGGFRFRYLDNLQYKLDNAADWTLTALANTPSILLENLPPGTHTLHVKYPANLANIFTYEIEVNRSVWDSPVWYIAGSITLSAAIFFFIYRTRLRKAKDKTTRTKLELQAIQAQLNPHFVFNALGSIQYLMNRNDKENADHYLAELAKLLRHSLNNGEKELIPLSVELNMLDGYIHLEQMRFKFQYEMAVDPTLETENLSVPPMLMQPLIENAIRHGVAAKGASGRLSINVVANNDELMVAIIDNGRGFDQSQATKGFGIRLVEDRIAILKKQHYIIDLSFSNGEPGTIVSVRFKNLI